MTGKQNKYFTRAIFFALFLLTACKGNIYSEYHKFDNYTWNRFDKVKFEIPIEKEGTTGDIIISVRHLDQLPLEELPLNLILVTPSGEERILDKTINLKNEKNEFRGDVAGSYWDVEEVIWPGFYFNNTGTYVLEIENINPKMQIPAIVDLGLIIRKK